MEQQITTKNFINRRSELGCELCASLFIAKYQNQIIITPMYDVDGPSYEQESPLLLPVDCSSTELGRKVKEALFSFDKKQIDLRYIKRTEWPSFKASASASVRAFERDYTHILISSYHPCFFIMIEGHPKKYEDIIIKSTISSGVSPGLDDEKLGSRIRKVFKACCHLDNK